MVCDKNFRRLISKGGQIKKRCVEIFLVSKLFTEFFGWQTLLIVWLQLYWVDVRYLSKINT